MPEKEIVPTGLIRAVVAPYGAKLFRKRKVTSIYNYSHGAPYNATNTFPYGPSASRKGRAPSLVTDYAKNYTMAMQEYEYLSFFGPGNVISNWSNCRVCNLLLWGKKERDEHLAKTPCRFFLIEALKRLRRDKKCAVCNKAEIAFTKLGVFLCGEGCLSTWKHAHLDQAARYNIKEALRLVGWREGLVERKDP